MRRTQRPNFAKYVKNVLWFFRRLFWVISSKPKNYYLFGYLRKTLVVANVLGRLFVSFDRWIRRGHEVADLSVPNFSEIS